MFGGFRVYRYGFRELGVLWGCLGFGCWEHREEMEEIRLAVYGGLSLRLLLE